MRYRIEESYVPCQNLMVKDLNVGEIVLITDATGYKGHIGIRTEDHFFSLTNPKYQWSHPECCTLNVQRIPSRTKITLIVEDSL